jgi:hypothetical protein
METPLQFEGLGQGVHFHLPMAMDDFGIASQLADLDDATVVKELGEPASIVPDVEGEIGERQARRERLNDHGLGQLMLGVITFRSTLLPRPPEPKGNRDLEGPAAP